MKNLNLINPERRLGGHDFCGVNHANQTEVQIDNLSVSGRSEVSMTLDEQPGNHPVITPLSPRNHPLLPKQKSGKSLIRIGKNVAESHVRKYEGASRIWKYAAMVVLMLCLGVGEMWGWGSYTFSGDYLYFCANNIRNESGTSMEWMKDNAYARCYGALSSNESGGTTYDYYQVKVDDTNNIYRTVLPTGTWNLVQLVRCSSTGENWNWSYKMDAANFENGKNYLYDDGSNYHWSYFAEDAYVLFDNSNANWGNGSNYIYFNIGRSDYTSGGNDYKMTNIPNTKLYQYHIQKWANYDRFRFCNTSSYDAHNSAMAETPSVDGYTAIVQNSSDLVLKVNTSNLFTFSGTNGSSLTKHEYAAYSDLNKTITIKEKYNSTGAGAYAEVTSGTAHGTITASGYAFDSWTTCNATPSASIAKETATFSANADFGYTSTVTLTAVATKAGKAFVGWYKNDGTLISTSPSTTITVTGDETVYAYYKDEETHDITVYYKCGETEIQTNITESAVGISTTRTVTAPAIDHYEFTGWTLGSGVSQVSAAGNDITINSVTGDGRVYTLTANYKRMTRFYFANTDNWSSVYAYMWNSAKSSENSGWSSNEITSKTKSLCGTNVYYFDYDATVNSSWNSIIFHNGLTESSEKKTGDLPATGNEDKLYIFDKSDWYNDINDHTVTVVANASYKGTVTGGGTVKAYGCRQQITATPAPGYRFDGWVVSDGDEDHVIFESGASSATTYVRADKNVTITANFSNSGYVYFDRTAVNGTWSGDKVYMTCFNSTDLEWHSSNGSLTIKNWVDNAVHNVEMHRIPNTNIYYFDCTGYTASISKILFCDKSHPHPGGDNYFVLQGMGAAVEETINLEQNNMFVVENFNWKTKNNVGYCDGYWMKYNDTNSGLEIRVYDAGGTELTSDPVNSPIQFTATEAGEREFTANVSLSAGTIYKYKVRGLNGLWYTNEGNMTNGNCSDWPFYYRSERVGGGNCSFTTTGAGTYKFTLNCTDAGVLRVSLEFPLEEDDYQVVYQGKIKEGASASTHPSDFIRHLSAAGERTDTVSFYVREDWSLQLQKCTGFSADKPVWANEGLAISKSTLGITENGVYTFYVTQVHNGTTNTVTITKGEAYDGDYYIRSSAAGGGWEAYKTTPNNKLEHSDYAKAHAGYDYYHCHWVPTGKNVKFTIANDFSSCITDTVDNDAYVESPGNLPYEASVRFMYNNETNAISRAYLNGSNDGTAEYLAIYSKPRMGTDSIKGIDDTNFAEDGDGLTYVRFADNGNWVYQKDIKVLPGTHIRLISNYHFSDADHKQWFKGSNAGTWTPASTEQIIGGTSSDWQKVRLIYDFKTNNLICAWLVPDGTINSGQTINADVMILRTDQGDSEQITFGNASVKLDEVDTVYSALHLTYDHIANSSLPASQREYYWVSFPYDVKIEDIFGSVGDFNNEWGIMYYDGKGRAEKGYWIDSPSFWKYFTSNKETLKAFEGYVVGVDIDLVGQAENTGKWVNGVRDIYLYFPSKDKVKSIVEKGTTIPIDQEGYECTIDRRSDKSSEDINKNRTIADSYWHCIGVPSFKDVSHDIATGYSAGIPTISDWSTNSLPYVYEWNSATNTYTPQTTSSYTFKAMYSYIVQYAGDNITWSSAPVPEDAPNAVVGASRRALQSEENDAEWRLDLLNGEESLDRTYVRLSNNEAVTAGFEFNYDMTKEFNANRANIYTFAGYVPTAGNILPISEQTTVVPVGVQIAVEGEYTFAMPEGSNGTGAVLVDNIAGTRTNLGLTDYTVTLGKGTYDGRFVLELSPVAQTPTGIGEIASDQVPSAKARKVLIDGIMYIVRDGEVFDARGTKVK